MLDIRLVRNEPDMVRAALRRRGPHAEAALDTLLELDRARREVLMAVEEKRGLRNAVSEEIAQAKRGKEDASAKIEAMRAVGEAIKVLETQLRETASMENCSPIAGRAILTAERSKGVIKPARIAMKRATLAGPFAFMRACSVLWGSIGGDFSSAE